MMFLYYYQDAISHLSTAFASQCRKYLEIALLREMTNAADRGHMLLLLDRPNYC